MLCVPSSFGLPMMLLSNSNNSCSSSSSSTPSASTVFRRWYSMFAGHLSAACLLVSSHSSKNSASCWVTTPSAITPFARPIISSICLSTSRECEMYGLRLVIFSPLILVVYLSNSRIVARILSLSG